MLESTALKYKTGVILHSSFEAAAVRQSSPISKVTVNLGDNSLDIRHKLKICFSNQSTCYDWVHNHQAKTVMINTRYSEQVSQDSKGRRMALYHRAFPFAKLKSDMFA